MRAPSAFGIALSLIVLSACGRSADDVQQTQRVSEPTIAQSNQPSTASNALQPRRSLGQPRLSRLTANPPAQPVQSRTPASPTPPAATFSRYNGRAPNDARVPSDIIVRSNSALAARVPDQDTLPNRDVVDVGLNRVVTPARPASAKPKNTEVASIRRLPSPRPRPIAAMPTPVLRPIAQTPAIPAPIRVALPAPIAAPVAPALPPQPSITALRVPGLSAPSASLDTPPTGLPVPRSVEQAVPLGTVPASLGVANLQAAEAALPVSDQLEQSVADEGGALSWTQAASLIRAGEVESVTDIGEFEVLLQLCSGRGVISIQPTPTALADIEIPKVICGKSVSLTSQ